jgi:hypothetical protein
LLISDCLLVVTIWMTSNSNLNWQLTYQYLIQADLVKCKLFICEGRKSLCAL